MVNFYNPKKKQVKAKQSRASQYIEGVIDVLDAHGTGVMRNHSPVVFVDGALPGESCAIKITGQQRNVWHGRVSKVMRANEARQTPICQHYHQCGGCQLQHSEPEYALVQRQQALTSQWQRQLKLDHIPWVAPIRSTSTEYRRKVRLAVDGRNPNDVKLGFREAQGKRIVTIEQCPVLVPELDRLLVPLRRLLNEHKAAAGVGHIHLVAGDNVVEMVVRATKSLPNSFTAALTTLAEQERLNALIENAKGDIETLHHCAELEIIVTDSIRIRPKPGNFLQVNGAVNQEMVQQAMEWLQPNKGENIADLYAGLGNFSLPIAQTGAHVIAAEGVADMVQQADNNAQKEGITNIQWHHWDLNQVDSLKEKLASGIDKVVLDPSREGALAVCEALAVSTVPKILYISCNPSTFARDIQRLLDGGYLLEKVGLVEMFPYTKHMEVMAMFSRRR